MRIYVTYTEKDKGLAKPIIDFLRRDGSTWEFVFSEDIALPGEDFRARITREIRESDVVIAFISRHLDRSHYVPKELDWALAYYYERRTPMILPVILDDSPVPYDLLQFTYIQLKYPGGNNYANSKGYDSSEVPRRLFESISRMENTKKEEMTEKTAQYIDGGGLTYLEEVQTEQKGRARKHTRIAYGCYFLCFLLLCASVVLCLYKLIFTPESITDIPTAILRVFSGVSVLSILIGLARYMYVLGKSFMVEAAHCSDRAHAIAFGIFYLRLYKYNFEWLELKDVLQTWNIDKGSAFTEQQAKDIDPAVLDAFVEFAKSFRKSG